jgi:hypothetical protein
LLSFFVYNSVRGTTITLQAINDSVKKSHVNGLLIGNHLKIIAKKEEARNVASNKR